MSIAIDVLESAKNAHADLEKNLKISNLRCSFLYFSRKAYISNKSVDESVVKLMILVGSTFMALGGGGIYIFYKIYPHESELAFFVIVCAVIGFYLYRKNEIIKPCKHIELEGRPVWAYLKNFSSHISWGGAVKLALVELMLLVTGVLAIICIYNRGHYLLSLLLICLVAFIIIVILGLFIVFYNKFIGDAVLNK